MFIFFLSKKSSTTYSHVTRQDLEAELLAEEEKLAAATDAAQEKGKTGFLRIAATMENLRKKTGKGSGEFEKEAKADVLAAVLPVMTAFEEAEGVRREKKIASFV